MPNYAVIIPTMGRSTLDSAIQSVLSQSLPAAEIIVVAGRPPLISNDNLSRVQIIKNYGSESTIWTAAHNRNIGVAAISNEVKYVAFLDDDDTWLPEKMEIQINFLELNKEYVSISSAVYKLRGSLAYRRPLLTLGVGQDILVALYGKRRFLPSPYYTPTPGIVISTDVAQRITFDERLPGFEDTWWLHELQEAGIRIHQHREALVIVNANPVRSVSRDTISKNVFWAAKLSEVDKNLGVNYLTGICLRNAVFGLRWRDIRFYTKGKKFINA